jgi:hypothetical protein
MTEVEWLAATGTGPASHRGERREGGAGGTDDGGVPVDPWRVVGLSPPVGSITTGYRRGQNHYAFTICKSITTDSS